MSFPFVNKIIYLGKMEKAMKKKTESTMSLKFQ